MSWFHYSTVHTKLSAGGFVSQRTKNYVVLKRASSTGVSKVRTIAFSCWRWFCSRLYNEKAYCLSRGFVRRALELPLGGIESDINWLYYTNGRLAKVIRDSRTLIEKSRGPSHGDEDDLAVPRLTAGGIITLERTLIKLQTLLEQHCEEPMGYKSIGCLPSI